MMALEMVPEGVQLTAVLEAIERAAKDDPTLKTERHEAAFVGPWLDVSLYDEDGRYIGAISYFSRASSVPSFSVRGHGDPQVLVERAARLVEVFHALKAKAVV